MTTFRLEGICLFPIQLEGKGHGRNDEHGDTSEPPGHDKKIERAPNHNGRRAQQGRKDRFLDLSFTQVYLIVFQVYLIVPKLKFNNICARAPLGVVGGALPLLRCPTPTSP